MRERAELVRGVQAGEVSGVGLQQERNRQSAGPIGPLTKPREARFPHTTQAPGTTTGPRCPKGTPVPLQLGSLLPSLTEHWLGWIFIISKLSHGLGFPGTHWRRAHAHALFNLPSGREEAPVVSTLRNYEPQIKETESARTNPRVTLNKQSVPGKSGQ